MKVRKGHVIELMEEKSLSDLIYPKGFRFLVLKGGSALFLLDVLNKTTLSINVNSIDTFFKVVDPKTEHKIEEGYEKISFSSFGEKNSASFDLKVFVGSKQVGILQNLGWGTDSEFYSKNSCDDRVISNVLKKMSRSLPSGSKDRKIDFLRIYLDAEKKYFCFYSMADFLEKFKKCSL